MSDEYTYYLDKRVIELESKLQTQIEINEKLKTQLGICQDIAMALGIEHNEKVHEGEKLKEVVSFYAYVESWRNSGNAKINRISYNDTELLTINYDGKWLNKVSVGGKKAREILKGLE